MVGGRGRRPLPQRGSVAVWAKACTGVRRARKSSLAEVNVGL